MIVDVQKLKHVPENKPNSCEGCIFHFDKDCPEWVDCQRGIIVVEEVKCQKEI